MHGIITRPRFEAPVCVAAVMCRTICSNGGSFLKRETVRQTQRVAHGKQFFLNGFSDGDAEILAFEPDKVFLLAGSIDPVAAWRFCGSSQTAQDVPARFLKAVKAQKSLRVDHKEEVSQVVGLFFALSVQPVERFQKTSRLQGGGQHLYYGRIPVTLVAGELLTDPGSFQEIATGLASVDILEFPEYPEKLAKGRANTGLNDGMVIGSARIAGWPVLLGVADFRFMGGSMGSVYGERVTRALEEALERRVPAILVCASGGARMQEGLVSLMQMAKTSAAVGRLNEAGVPYITVLTDPTTAGVFASFASLGDIIIAEPGALMRFAGERVAAQAGPAKQPPPNFQTAEFYLEHGAIDLIIHRKDLQDTLSRILTFCCHGRLAREGGEALAAVR